MPKTPQEVLDKYRRRVQSAQPDYEAGVRNPSRSWEQGYRQSVPRMVQGFQEAVASGRPQRRVQELGDAGWQQRTLEKATRYSQSAERAATNYGAKVQQVLSAGEAGRQAAMAVDGTTQEGRYERVRANGEAIKRAWGRS